MNIWKASPLKDKDSLLQRFLLRLIWCSVGAVIAILLDRDDTALLIVLPVLVIFISTLGLIIDSLRLTAKPKGTGTPEQEAENNDDEKLMLYINLTWLKAFIMFFITAIIPYQLILFVLWKTSGLPDHIWWNFAIWGSFAIAFIWSIIRKLKLANKKAE